MTTPWIRAAIFFVCMFCCESEHQQAQTAGSPILTVRVAPPAVPHRMAQAKIGALEAKSEAEREEFSQLLEQAMNTSLLETEERFRKILAKQSAHHLQQLLLQKHHQRASFLEKHTGNQEREFAVKVMVLEEEKTDRATLDKFDTLNSKRIDIERKLFQQACREFAALTDIMADEFQAQLSDGLNSIRSAAQRRSHNAASFLGSLKTSFSKDAPTGDEVNVRVLVTEKWPMVSEIVEDWQRKQDLKEEQARKAILDAEARFLKACNGMIERLLISFVDQISISLSA